MRVLWCIFLCIPVYAYAGQGRTPTDTDAACTFADHLAAQGNYRFAIHEMKRRLVTDTLPRDQQARAQYRIGRWYEHLGRYRQAADQYEEALALIPDTARMRTRIHLALVKNSVRRRQYTLARFELNICASYADTLVWQDTISLLRAFIYAYRYRTDSVRAVIARLDTSVRTSERIAALDSLLDAYDALTFTHPRFAYGLSGRLPGAGQAYSGDWPHAIGGFLLNTALTSVLAWNGYRTVMADTRRQRYIAGMDFAVWGVMVWRRYFDGNKKVAYEAAVRHNRNNQRTYRDRLDVLFAF